MYERRTKRRFDVGGSSTAHPHHRFETRTLGHASAKTNPYRCLTTSMTHANSEELKMLKLRNIRLVGLL